MKVDPFPTLTAALDSLRRTSDPNDFPGVPLKDSLPQLLVALDDVPGAVKLLHERAAFVETETGPGSPYADAFAAALARLERVTPNDPVKVRGHNLTPSNAPDDHIFEFHNELILFRKSHQKCTITNELETIVGYIVAILRDYPLPPDAIENLNKLNRLATQIIAQARNIYADSCREIWLAKTIDNASSSLFWVIDEHETSKGLFAAASQLDAELRARHQRAHRGSTSAPTTGRPSSNPTGSSSDADADVGNHFPVPSAFETALIRLLGVFTEGVADDRFNRASDLLASESLTVNEKLTEIHKLLPFPRTASARKLGKMLGVSSTAVKNSEWWKTNRRGRHENKVGERLHRHKDRKMKIELNDQQSLDGER